MFTPKRMYGCCMCGSQFKFTDLQPLDPGKMDPKLMRSLSPALCEFHLCWDCRRRCPQCSGCIPQVQLRAHGRCAECAAQNKSGAKRRKI